MARFFSRREAALGVAVVLAAGAAAGTAGAAVITLSRDGPATTATVVRTDLTMKADGTVGYGGSYTVPVPSGTSAAQVAQDQQAVARDQQALAGDEQAESDASVAQSGAPSAGAQLTAKSGYDQALDKVLSDQVTLRGDQENLASAQASAVNPGTVYTWLPAVGQVIRQDQRLYSVSGQPVPLLYGGTPAYRAFYPGMSDGPDVRQLNRDLAALGFGAGLARSGTYSQATVLAVERWQARHGLPVTGQIPLGGVAFEPGPVRVTSVPPSAGQSVSGAGGTVLTATGTTPVVNASLAAGQQALVRPGDTVSVTLPGGSATVGGRVKTVSGPTATITLDGALPPTVAEGAPVTVTVGSRRARHVLAVPVNALLALPGGGYGVDVVTGGGSLRLVGVATGLRSDTLVQVSGPGIADGTTVALPASLGERQPG